MILMAFLSSLEGVFCVFLAKPLHSTMMLLGSKKTKYPKSIAFPFNSDLIKSFNTDYLFKELSRYHRTRLYDPQYPKDLFSYIWLNLKDKHFKIVFPVDKRTLHSAKVVCSDNPARLKKRSRSAFLLFKYT